MSTVDDVESELDTPFKRWITLAVTVVALLGGLVALAAGDASIRVSEATREAQLASVNALATQNTAAVDVYEQFGNWVNATMLERRQDMDEVGAQLLGQDTVVGLPQDYARAADSVQDLTPLLAAGELRGRPDLLWNEKFVAPNLAQLRQEAQQRRAAAWDDKSDLYVGAVTLLAIAVTLLGLSLTVGPRGRRVFVWPAALLVVVTMIGSLVVLVRPVAGTPEEAIAAVVEGDRLIGSRNFDAALESYERAIALDPDFATAYVRRAAARLIGASPERNTSVYVVTASTPEARRAATADYLKAIELGGEDYQVLVNLGGNYFHFGDYRRTVEYSQRAIEVNPDLPLPWMNLGLGLVGQGKEAQARQAYARAIELIRARPTRLERHELYAAARGTLMTVAEQQPAREELAILLQEELVKAEGEQELPDAVPAPSASVSDLNLAVAGSVLGVSGQYERLPKGSRVAWLVYYRAAEGEQWVQRGDPAPYERVALDNHSGSLTKMIFDANCPSGGEYRLDLYADGRRVASQTVAVPTAKTALTPVFDGLGGIALCRPEGWGLDTTTTGRAVLTAPDQRTALTVRTVPLLSPPTSQAGRDALTATVLNRLQVELSPNASLLGTTSYLHLYGAAGTGRLLQLSATVRGWVWASVGLDGVVRTVVVRFPADTAADVDALLARVLFDRIL